jgi:hypothetical protein
MKLPLMGGVGPAAETSSHLTPPSRAESSANFLEPTFIRRRSPPGNRGRRAEIGLTAGAGYIRERSYPGYSYYSSPGYSYPGYGYPTYAYPSVTLGTWKPVCAG